MNTSVLLMSPYRTHFAKLLEYFCNFRQNKCEVLRRKFDFQYRVCQDELLVNMNKYNIRMFLF